MGKLTIDITQQRLVGGIYCVDALRHSDHGGHPVDRRPVIRLG